MAEGLWPVAVLLALWLAATISAAAAQQDTARRLVDASGELQSHSRLHHSYLCAMSQLKLPTQDAPLLTVTMDTSSHSGSAADSFQKQVKNCAAACEELPGCAALAVIPSKGAPFTVTCQLLGEESAIPDLQDDHIPETGDDLPPIHRKALEQLVQLDTPAKPQGEKVGEHSVYVATDWMLKMSRDSQDTAMEDARQQEVEAPASTQPDQYLSTIVCTPRLDMWQAIGSQALKRVQGVEELFCQQVSPLFATAVVEKLDNMVGGFAYECGKVPLDKCPKICQSSGCNVVTVGTYLQKSQQNDEDAAFLRSALPKDVEKAQEVAKEYAAKTWSDVTICALNQAAWNLYGEASAQALQLPPRDPNKDQQKQETSQAILDVIAAMAASKTPAGSKPDPTAVPTWTAGQQQTPRSWFYSSTIAVMCGVAAIVAVGMACVYIWLKKKGHLRKPHGHGHSVHHPLMAHTV